MMLAILALLHSANANANASLRTSSSRDLQAVQAYQYTSDHVVARASAISKDFQSLNSFLAQDNAKGRADARAIYELGAYCQSYATLTLNQAIEDAITQGTSLTGTSDSGKTVQAILHRDAFPGDTTIEVMYLIPDDGIAAICSVAGNPNPQYDNCKYNIIEHIIEQSEMVDVDMNPYTPLFDK